MTLKLVGSSDGSVSLSAPSDTSPSGTDVTLTLPTSDGDANQVLQTNGTGTLSWVDQTDDPQILQIVHDSTSTSDSIGGTGSTWTDTALELTVTSTIANSKFVVIANCVTYMGSSSKTDVGGGFRIDRNGTGFLEEPDDSFGSYSIYWSQSGSSGTKTLGQRATLMFMDEPSASSGTSLTYKVQAQSYDSATFTFCPDNARSDLIVYEVRP